MRCRLNQLQVRPKCQKLPCKTKAEVFNDSTLTIILFASAFAATPLMHIQNDNILLSEKRWGTAITPTDNQDDKNYLIITKFAEASLITISFHIMRHDIKKS